MAADLPGDPDTVWLDHADRVGLVVAPSLLKELGLVPIRQTAVDSAVAGALVEQDAAKPAVADPWVFAGQVLGWQAPQVAGAPDGPPVPTELTVRLPEHGTTLQPSWAVAGPGGAGWQLLLDIQPPGIHPDKRGAAGGWEATPHQRFERLLRDTGVFAGAMLTDNELRLVYAPKGETSGYLGFHLRPLGSVAGRPMLGGLKLLLDRSSLFTAAESHRLPAVLAKSREAQASVSTALAGQVLGALHELLRGFDGAEPELIRELAASRPDHLYEGLLTVLMRLVFLLYAEDRDLLPSREDARSREVYEAGYSLRGLYARLVEDAALNPDTMDERRGGWGRLLALFHLVHKGHATGFVRARGGKLFDPDESPFLEGRRTKEAAARIATISDGCLLRILHGLMTVQLPGRPRERLSYRALDVEQIGSVYETVMGFTVQASLGRVLAIKAGKNNRTPVFVDLDRLLAHRGKERIKALKEDAERGQLSAVQAKAIEAAGSIEALVAALDGIVDERGSPGKRPAPAGSPILQPTNERRRTGSHYTPRSLTAPIVRHALEPAFDRLGPDATPDQVLDLKVCDPAMGSGAFLVEACRLIGTRLVEAWNRNAGTRPTIPPDEDEQLHARRLVAQRCLYGVDKNPRAVDLARLSLWLATLARDHEFTFLDHALKCGDSLVGLTREQIMSLHWTAGEGLPLFRTLVRDRFEAAVSGRREIRDAPDDVARTVQETRYRKIEDRLGHVRLVGNAVVAGFFSEDKAGARERRRQAIEDWANGAAGKMWPKLENLAAELGRGAHPVAPFHWEIEFPEVFARDNPGFDAVIGNPPFLGGSKIEPSLGRSYAQWVLNTCEGAHGKTDLVGYFFRRVFGLVRTFGSGGLVATNTISQGETRATSLLFIVGHGGTIYRAIRRLRWPGEASVIVSVIHFGKGVQKTSVLNDGPVRRISAYLMAGEFDAEPLKLSANRRKAFLGTKIYGSGFLFDDAGASKGVCSSISEMKQLLAKYPSYKTIIKPYLGGEEINTSPFQESDPANVFRLGVCTDCSDPFGCDSPGAVHLL